jgi:hypothetical protein
MLTNIECAPATMGDTSHGWSGRSTARPGESKKTSSSDLSWFFLLWLMPPTLDFLCSALLRTHLRWQTFRRR